jgi:hypothetical protein
LTSGISFIQSIIKQFIYFITATTTEPVIAADIAAVFFADPFFTGQLALGQSFPAFEQSFFPAMGHSFFSAIGQLALAFSLLAIGQLALFTFVLAEAFWQHAALAFVSCATVVLEAINEIPATKTKM